MATITIIKAMSLALTTENGGVGTRERTIPDAKTDEQTGEWSHEPDHQSDAAENQGRSHGPERGPRGTRPAPGSEGTRALVSCKFLSPSCHQLRNTRKCFVFLSSQAQRSSRDVLLEMLNGRCSRNGQHHGRSFQQPSKRYLVGGDLVRSPCMAVASSRRDW